MGIIYTWLKRERPAHVVIQETRRVSLLDIEKTQLEQITVLYSDADQHPHSVRSLEQVTLVIYNNGTRDIVEPIEVVLELLRGSPKKGGEVRSRLGYWTLVMEADDNSLTLTHNDDDPYKGLVTLTLPYLNSFSTHGHFSRLYLVSEYPIELRLRQGVGKGWSAQLVSTKEYSELVNRWERLLVKVMSSVLLMGLIGTVIAALRSPMIRVNFYAAETDLNYVIEYYKKIRDLASVSGPLVVWRGDVLWGLALERMGGMLAVFVSGVTVAAFFLLIFSEEIAGFAIRQRLRIQPSTRFAINSRTSRSIP